MTPHEVFRTYLQNRSSRCSPLKKDYRAKEDAPFHHWGYHKHNTVTGPAPVATQLLHAAGIAFASKLRKASVVTVAYCDNDAINEPDFLEGLRFAAQHQLPVVFICELAFLQPPKGTIAPSSCLDSLPLPEGLTHQQVDGTDVVTVYQSMRAAMQRAREGHGPVLLEMRVVRPVGLVGSGTGLDQPFVFAGFRTDYENEDMSDSLVRCQRYLQEHGEWDDDWANQLCARISTEIECAWHDVLHDALQSS
jgi:TPP-dependent pyruvate/acetoin dehydrogenase alpha subunit